MERDENLLRLAPKRIETIEHLLDHGQVYAPRKEAISFLSLSVARWCFDGNSQLIGEEHLRTMLNLQEQGAKFIQSRNHLADIDHGIASSTLRRNGYGEVSERSVIAAGLKMDERLSTRIPSYSEHRIRIPTPFDNAAVKQALENAHLYTPEEIDVLKALMVGYKGLAAKALREFNRHIIKGDQNLVLYPEATRSRTGFVGPAQEETSLWFKFLAKARPQGYCLPMAIEGGEVLAPPESGRFKLWKRTSTKVIVGAPFPVERVVEFAAKTPNPERTIADTVLAHVAVLLEPNYVRPEDLAKAKSLKEAFDGFRISA